MLGWQSFSGWHCDRVTVSIAYYGCLYICYGWQCANHLPITLFIRPKILEAPLTLIFRMGNWTCHLLFCWQRLPICWLRITASISLSNYHTYITRKHWRSVDDQFRMIATLTLTTLQIKAAKLRLWVNAVAQPLDYTRCNAQNCQCFVVGLLTLIFRCSNINSNHMSQKGGQYFDHE